MFSTWRRRILIVLVPVLAGLSIPVVVELRARSQARSELKKIIVELDAADPRWRLEDIEADRQPVPNDKNSAKTVVAAFGLLQKNRLLRIHEELEKVPPPMALRIDQAEKLLAELKPLEATLQIARKLSDQPNGRFKIDYSVDFLSTMVPDLYKTVEVANLLDLEATLFLHEKKIDNAWNSNRALLNVGRAIGDEPLLISTLRRLSMAEYSVRSLERVLAQGEFKTFHLEERQKALEDELAVPHFLIGMRGERAGTDYFLTNIENGKISVLRTLDNIGKKNPRNASTFWEPVHEFFAFSMVLRSHATLLDLHTKVIEAAKLPPTKRYEAMTEIDSTFITQIDANDKSQILTRLLFPGVIKVAQTEQRVHTRMACAVAAIGAERFRLKKDRWPKSLEEIVEANCLKKGPVDLFDGKPLRFRRTTDGLVIYSIGPDGNYDGKAMDDLHNIDESVIRVEFRLWDPAQRRQPPLPVKPKEQIEE